MPPKKARVTQQPDREKHAGKRSWLPFQCEKFPKRFFKTTSAKVTNMTGAYIPD
jgi:hypothetical protein